MSSKTLNPSHPFTHSILSFVMSNQLKYMIMTCLYYLQSNEISLKDHNNIEINKLQAETIVSKQLQACPWLENMHRSILTWLINRKCTSCYHITRQELRYERNWNSKTWMIHDTKRDDKKRYQSNSLLSKLKS